MMLNQKKRVYLGLMLFCALALIVDRVVLRDSATGPAVVAAGQIPALPASPTPSLSIPELPFPQGIEPLDPTSEIRDLFTPPPLRRQNEMNAASDNDDSPTTAPNRTGQAPRDLFVTTHVLHAVMVNERLRIAIVDGQWRRIGESVDGCTLTDITGGEVRFECYDGTASLRLHADELPSGG